MISAAAVRLGVPTEPRRIEPDIDKDLALAQRLLDLKHMSPFEHQAKAWTNGVQKTTLNGNLRGWHQFRKMIEAQAA